MTKCNVPQEYWIKPFKFETENSQIPSSHHVSMSKWGNPARAVRGNKGHGKSLNTRKRRENADQMSG